VDDFDSIEEKTMAYEGFAKVESSVAKKGAKNPGALAAWIGRRKYGKGKFQSAAAKGKKMRGMSARKRIPSAKAQAAAMGG
jgi:hypothetical protein